METTTMKTATSSVLQQRKRGSSDTWLVMFSKEKHCVQHCPTLGCCAEGHRPAARGSGSRGQAGLIPPGGSRQALPDPTRAGPRAHMWGASPWCQQPPAGDTPRRKRPRAPFETTALALTEWHRNTKPQSFKILMALLKWDL